MTRVTKDVVGNLSDTVKVKLTGTYEKGQELESAFASVDSNNQQVLSINHRKDGSITYSFSRGEDFKKWESVISKVLADIDDLYNEVGMENVGVTYINGAITEVSND